jgi:hypothetical protein
MEKQKRKSWVTLSGDLKRIRREQPDPKIIEDFNKLREEDEKLERERQEKERRDKKIAASGTDGDIEASL